MNFECNTTQQLRMKSAIIDFASSFKWVRSAGLTLTLKQRLKQQAIDSYAASANFRHFMNRLNRKVYGNRAHRHGRGLKVLPVLEFDELVRYHNHAVVEFPLHMEFDEFNAAIVDSWHKTQWGYDHTDVIPMTDDGWIRYIFKLDQKPQYDLAIDWMNARKD